NRLLIRRFSRDPNELEPSYTRRILKCAMVSVTNAVIPVALILIELILLNWIGLLTGLFGTFIKLSAISLATFILVYGMAKAALAPDNLQWRIIPVSPAYTAKLLYAIGTVFGLI